MKLAAVRRLEHPPHATPPRPYALRRRLENGEGAPHRLLQPTYVTCTCRRSPDSRCVRVTFVIRHHPPEQAPPDTPGRFAFDDANRASADCSAHASADAAVLPSLNPGGLRNRRALEGMALDSRRFLPRTRCAGRPLTSPVANESRVFPPAARRQGRRSAALRQERRLLATRDAFHRRVPACASPPPISLLCRSGSGFRRSFTVSPREEGDG